MSPARHDAGELLAELRALEAAGAQAVWIAAAEPEGWLVLGAAAALTQRILLGVIGGDLSEGAAAALQKLSGGRALLRETVGDGWVEVAMPPDRASWTAMMRAQEEAGVAGVIVPWDARLVDLLRNPGEEDRSDLAMSTG